MVNKKTSNKLKLLRNTSFAEIAYEQIRESILFGRISPGDHINENKLSSELGISRAPIREACRQLQNEGLVEISKNKGVFVVDLSAEEAVELYEIRIALEVLAVEKAAEKVDEKDLVLLTRCVDDLKSAVKLNDPTAHQEAAVNFHQTIAGISGSLHLKKMINSVSNRISLFRWKLTDFMGSVLSFKDEENILIALKAGDGKRASEIMKSHIIRGKNHIIDNLIQ